MQNAECRNISHFGLHVEENMTKALFRDTLRSIRRTFSRYISIVIIVALGVGFFAGLKAVSPNMKQAAVDFYKEHNLADVVIHSTAGFDERDRAAVLALPGVKSATLSRSIDGILYSMDETKKDTPEQSVTGTAYVIRVIGYDFEEVAGSGSGRLNQLSLVEGQFPKRPNECVVSVYENDGDKEHYALGQVINVRGDHEDLLDTVQSDYYRVVGVVNTPEFVSMELGASQAGGGELSGYIYIPDSAFKLEHYTTMYIGAEGTAGLEAYTKEYSNAVRQVTESLEEAGKTIVQKRADRIRDEYGPQIEQSKLDLEKAKTEGLEELNKAKKDIQDLKEGVLNGPEDIKKAKADLEKAKKDYETGQVEYDKKLAEYNKGIADYTAATEQIGDVSGKLLEYENGKSRLERAEYSLEIAEMGIKAGKSAIRVGKSAVESGDPVRIESALAIMGQYFPLTEDDYTVEGLQARIDEAEIDLAKQEKALESSKEEIEAGRKELAEAESQLADLRKFEAAGKELNAAKVQLDLAWSKLEAAPGQIAKAEKDIAEAERKLASGMSTNETADQDIAKAELKYEQEVADAERKIRRSENQMAALANAQWIINDRDGFAGYTNYGETSDSMEQFAVVFPVLFFLVAALVSLTTMTRMVEDERMQIGVLKASGYSGLAIAFKYLFYAATAGILGSVVGLAIGFTFIPFAIFSAYKILYLIPTMRPGFFFDTSVIGLVAALVSTVGAVVFSITLALRNSPAQLMRPKAPKAGKRVFLEWFPFIWKRLNFNGKVTVRNLMRNKKRFVMTFAGIMGCTALLLTGFGIGNSVGTMLDKQFGHESIQRFDAQVLLQADIHVGESEALEVFEQPGRIQSAMPVFMRKMYASTASFGRQLDVTLVVPGKMNKVPEFIYMADETTGVVQQFSDEGAFINGKTAELMGLKVGDKITVQSGPVRAEVPVAAIVRNYVYHYVYISPTCYEKYFNVERTAFNIVMLKLEPELNRTNKEAKEKRAQLGRDLTDSAEVITVAYNQNIIDSVGAMLDIMRAVVVAVFTSASGALAFVVLYNLNNINIYERIRELATIKVLGFYDKEADMFIYRENIIISILGLIGGLALGIPIHAYVIRAAEIESMMFVRTLAPSNYIFAAAITVVFAVAINAMMHKKIKEINMVEALKSVE